MLGYTVTERIQISIPLQHHHFITEDGGTGENVAARIHSAHFDFYQVAYFLQLVLLYRLQVASITRWLRQF
jgi:hypothetical protein